MDNRKSGTHVCLKLSSYELYSLIYKTPVKGPHLACSNPPIIKPAYGPDEQTPLASGGDLSVVMRENT